MDYLSYPMEFIHKVEYQFNERTTIPWMHAHWQWSIYISLLYLALVLGGRRYMRDRPPYDLRAALCMWSTALSAFSFYAVLRIYPPSFNMVYVGGWRHAVCDSRSYVGSVGTGVWAFLFPFSKLPELFDTLFIVLRKSKLNFLHVYHHITVFVYCWYSYAYPIGPGIWFGIVNYTVHSIMYAYYALTATGRRLPRWVSTCITLIQLSQMFVGIWLNYVSITSLLNGNACNTNWFAIGLSIFFYTSYAILFANFFYWSYCAKGKGGAESEKGEKVKGGSSRVPVEGARPVVNGVQANGSTSGLKKGGVANGSVKH
ncbi:hypothetical protein EMCRGX_G008257 [Ephydatia muelleri]